MKEFYLVYYSEKGDIQLSNHPGVFVTLGTKNSYLYAAVRMPLFSTIVQGNVSFEFDDKGNLETPPSTISKFHGELLTFFSPLSMPLSTKMVLQHYIAHSGENIILNDFDFAILSEVKSNVLDVINLKHISMSGDHLGGNSQHVEFIKEIITRHRTSLENMVLINNSFSELEKAEIQTCWGAEKTGLSF